MKSAAVLISAIAGLLWPLIAIGILVTFGRSFLELLRSAKSRKFAIRIGGSEVSMDKASETTSEIIPSLQSKVGQNERRKKEQGRQDLTPT